LAAGAVTKGAFLKSPAAQHREELALSPVTTLTVAGVAAALSTGVGRDQVHLTVNGAGVLADFSGGVSHVVQRWPTQCRPIGSGSIRSQRLLSSPSPCPLGCSFRGGWFLPSSVLIASRIPCGSGAISGRLSGPIYFSGPVPCAHSSRRMESCRPLASGGGRGEERLSRPLFLCALSMDPSGGWWWVREEDRYIRL